MAQDQELNKILKQMWVLDEKSVSGMAIDVFEKEFYNRHLQDIQKYYSENNDYWKNKISL